MTLTLIQLQEAIPDLSFPAVFERVGTCPCCNNHGLTVKLVQWRDNDPISLEYEPWCPRGCAKEAIIASCIERLERASLEVG